MPLGQPLCCSGNAASSRGPRGTAGGDLDGGRSARGGAHVGSRGLRGARCTTGGARYPVLSQAASLVTVLVLQLLRAPEHGCGSVGLLAGAVEFPQAHDPPDRRPKGPRQGCRALRCTPGAAPAGRGLEGEEGCGRVRGSQGERAQQTCPSL